jgi:hypothetical protein
MKRSDAGWWSVGQEAHDTRQVAGQEVCAT